MRYVQIDLPVMNHQHETPPTYDYSIVLGNSPPYGYGSTYNEMSSNNDGSSSDDEWPSSASLPYGSSNPLNTGESTTTLHTEKYPNSTITSSTFSNTPYEEGHQSITPGSEFGTIMTGAYMPGTDLDLITSSAVETTTKPTTVTTHSPIESTTLHIGSSARVGNENHTTGKISLHMKQNAMKSYLCITHLKSWFIMILKSILSSYPCLKFHLESIVI